MNKVIKIDKTPTYDEKDMTAADGWVRVPRDIISQLKIIAAQQKAAKRIEQEGVSIEEFMKTMSPDYKPDPSTKQLNTIVESFEIIEE